MKIKFSPKMPDSLQCIAALAQEMGLRVTPCDDCDVVPMGIRIRKEVATTCLEFYKFCDEFGKPENSVTFYYVELANSSRSEDDVLFCEDINLAAPDSVEQVVKWLKKLI